MASKGATERKEVEIREPVSINFGHPFEVFDELWRNIANRAYELFEGRGRSDGQDMDDWLAAERALFASVPIEVAEKDNQLIGRAEVPGFDKDDLKVFLDPGRRLGKCVAGRQPFVAMAICGPRAIEQVPWRFGHSIGKQQLI